MKSTDTYRFSEVPRAEIQRSSFDRSHGHKTTFDAGILIPFYTDEALPGDTHNVKANLFGRLATPLRPVMDNIHLDTHFFSVPKRLIWDNFTKQMGEQIDPGDSTDYLEPIVDSATGGFQPGSIYDYFGWPTVVPQLEASALYPRAYYKIWNEWFRDQNMQDSLTVPTDDGPDSVLDYILQRRGKRHDYFTSALPWPEKGGAVEIPLGDRAPVEGIGVASPSVYEAGLRVVNTPTGVQNWNNWADTNDNEFVINSPLDPVIGNPDIYADLSQATASTVSELRQAFQIQKMLERDARGGTRYPEMILAHFNVVHPDASWRSEYLGGGTSRMNVTPVPNTTDALGASLGKLGGYGTVAGGNHGYTKSFTEHCIIIGFVSLRADLTYSQGLNRRFSRRTRYDNFFPALAHLGEQPILNKEIWATDNTDPTLNNSVFGYQERYAEYRYEPSKVTGLFRHNIAGSLDVWHLGQDFLSLPTLNSTFIEENPPIDRVIAVPSEPHVILDSYIQVRSARPMPTYGSPGMIDHF